MNARLRRTTALAPAALAVAALVALSGCTPGSVPTNTATTQPGAPTTEAAAPGGMTGESAPTEDPGSSAAQPTPEDPFKDSARARSWASDANIKIDKEGDGVVPKASIEADLIDLFKNKFKMKVKKADCPNDMKVTKWYGFVTCDVFDDKKTYYGTVKLVDHKGNQIQYEVKFPGIDKKDLHLDN